MKQPKLHQRRSPSVTSILQKLFFGLCATGFLLFIGISSFKDITNEDVSNLDNPRAVSISDMNDVNNVEIKYSYVGDGRNDSAAHAPDAQTKIARYAAFERSINNSTWKPLTIELWAKYLSQDNDSAKKHRENFVKLLAECTPHMKAYAFETKGASYSTATQKQFEFVLVDDPYLFTFAEGNPDPFTFKEQLQCVPANAPGCVFPNLGSDAILVAPRPLMDVGGSTLSDGLYSHLATFVRNGPSWQVNEFWRLVASEYLKVLKERQVWLSTEGGGVAWLHVRLGKRPKYYKYDEFRSELEEAL